MELVLEGWLEHDRDGNIALKREKDWCADSISESIMSELGYRTTERGLGGKELVIKDANIQIWYSDVKCTLEEAQMNLDSYMETGELFTNGDNVGYSEYTITGFSVNEFTIGGHDLTEELDDHLGQYVIFRLEC